LKQVYLDNFSLIFFPKASLANYTVKNKSCCFTFLSRIEMKVFDENIPARRAFELIKLKLCYLFIK